MSRSELLGQIRPSLDVEQSTGLEAFQNQTLRPILKFQHPMTQQMLHNHHRFGKVMKIEMTREQFHHKVKTLLTSDKVFRQTIIGVIVGQMTLEEYAIYESDTKELNKRMISMQVKRYVDTQYPSQV